MNTLMTRDQAVLMEKVIVTGDLSGLSAEERIRYYKAVCDGIGLNPLTKPFDYIRLDGKLVLYAKRDATDQLRRLHGISITIIGRERLGDIYAVTARAISKDGRTDEAVGAVAISTLKGKDLANALMKAETKAKRRVTLSIAGLGLLDETEIEDIDDRRKVMGEATVSRPDNVVPLHLVPQTPQEATYKTPPKSDKSVHQTDQAPLQTSLNCIQNHSHPSNPQSLTTTVEQPSQSYSEHWIEGTVIHVEGAPFMVNNQACFVMMLDSGERVLFPDTHPVIEYLDRMEGKAFQFLVRDYNEYKALCGSISAVRSVKVSPEKEDVSSDHKAETEKPYLLQSYEEGERPNGEPWAKITVLNRSTQQTSVVLAVGDIQMREARKIKKGVPFQMETEEENFFTFLTSVS
ncbi:hypothetical protein [Brevibacillus dissolubilis]|uniref:hypothetical protein n=1 Tax=Brevibacillus dissolubilis TaxID=1844116 RepID=UPI001116194C|nr:hypothetical protein [Brevibacillus dissolubilis]